MSAVRTATALYDFEGGEPDELPFSAGAIITLRDTSNAEWWEGELDGWVGLFPVQFVRENPAGGSRGGRGGVGRAGGRNFTPAAPVGGSGGSSGGGAIADCGWCGAKPKSAKAKFCHSCGKKYTDKPPASTATGGGGGGGGRNPRFNRMSKVFTTGPVLELDEPVFKVAGSWRPNMAARAATGAPVPSKNAAPSQPRGAPPRATTVAAPPTPAAASPSQSWNRSSGASGRSSSLHSGGPPGRGPPGRGPPGRGGFNPRDRPMPSPASMAPPPPPLAKAPPPPPLAKAPPPPPVAKGAAAAAGGKGPAAAAGGKGPASDAAAQWSAAPAWQQAVTPSKRDTINVDALISNLASAGIDLSNLSDSDDDVPPPVAPRSTSSVSGGVGTVGGVTIAGNELNSGLTVPERMKKKAERAGIELFLFGPDYGFFPENKDPTVTDTSVYGLALLKPAKKTKWKELWFAIYDNFLICCKKRKDWSPKHAWPLASIVFTRISHLDLAFALEINAGGSTYHFACNSQQTLDTWVEWMVPY
ncbi:uncharacterized protein AMSG_03966 [Thecamonas trahens ATCC 50062]|uniref:SH3 domain-containing protein n=1 Tax=Thecamonas trahens ATCC 50062 TaxID=461836 RepID=A0A0L0D5V7_THETB|nr:hypothetical protein AMSG_03966 [Thecamonas trahens ATCC 50062]KNC47739.1 hypothetical protein AMSG_03966 [Thecamonas trahens ATCC 50062]|eukprot:XP_013759217.1 hypothetical protein AMSG_03966 [Thecamonas trahens ATCC 50062]